MSRWEQGGRRLDGRVRWYVLVQDNKARRRRPTVLLLVWIVSGVDVHGIVRYPLLLFFLLPPSLPLRTLPFPLLSQYRLEVLRPPVKVLRVIWVLERARIV